MLRVNPIQNSGQAKSYYPGGDYYLEGRQEPALWHGKGAELLGLRGEVREQDFARLCDNLDPRTAAPLTARTFGNRRVGYDFTFSVPKSVSLLHALGGDERIAGELRGAVADTMAEAERDMAARVRRGGADADRATGNMVWCDFLHRTARPVRGEPDPHLHVHAVAFNATFDREEGRWKAGQFGGIKADAPYLQAAFRARLANRLQALGYELRNAGKGDFEVAGVPGRAVKEFSRRTSLIEKAAEALGVTRPETKAKLGATTREAKQQGTTRDDLAAGWRARLEPGEREAIGDAVARADGVRALAFDDRGALDWAVRHAFERDSVVAERQLLAHALRYGVGHVTPEGLHDQLARRTDLIRRTVGGRAVVSTHAVLGEERRIVAFAQGRRGRLAPLARPRDGLPALDALSASQRAAVYHVWYSRDPLTVVRGAAGTGKTTMLRAALAGVGGPCVVLAPSSEAGRGVLRREGFEGADTLARFLADEGLREQARGGLVVLDEAGLAGAHDLARLADAAGGLNARLLLLGRPPAAQERRPRRRAGPPGGPGRVAGGAGVGDPAAGGRVPRGRETRGGGPGVGVVRRPRPARVGEGIGRRDRPARDAGGRLRGRGAGGPVRPGGQPDARRGRGGHGRGPRPAEAGRGHQGRRAGVRAARPAAPDGGGAGRRAGAGGRGCRGVRALRREAVPRGRPGPDR
jgi:conjugative relaxase-like TrwC/TraI family protein